MRDHRGLHQPGQDRVHAHALARILDRGGAGEMQQRGLRGVVGRIGNAGPADAGDRRDVDDRAAALNHHQRNDVLHGEEHALEIHRHDAVPLLLGQFDHAADLSDADIVVEHVDVAEVRDAGLHHRLDVVALCHVGAERQREAALARDDVRGLLRGRVIDVDAEHLRAFARAGYRGRLAVTPAGADRAGADDQRDLVLQAVSHWPSPFASRRARATRSSGSCRSCSSAARRRIRNPSAA